MHMKVYGTPLCIDCRNYLAIQKNRGFEAEFVNITETSLGLRDFLLMRDSDPVFDSIKEQKLVGIPMFVSDDGKKTFDIDEAMAWLGLPPISENEIVEK